MFLCVIVDASIAEPCVSYGHNICSFVFKADDPTLNRFELGLNQQEQRPPALAHGLIIGVLCLCCGARLAS